MSIDMSQPNQENHLPTIDSGAGRDLRGPTSASSDDVARRLEAVMHSQYGVEKLLNRLKQSIFSAREFSSFLKERSILEDRYAQGYRKLVRHTSDSLQRPDGRQGSYLRYLNESMRINDRMAENGVQLAVTLQTMSEEIRETAENAERGRKHWKHIALDAEKKVSLAENDQQKARDRFNNAAEQYERVRTGERQGGKFGLKNKSPAQQEEALKEKADQLDQEYAYKTQSALSERREYETTHKPQIVRSIRDLVGECDASMSMQLAKLASISEKHIVSNGMAIAPIKGDTQSRGLRQIASEIDDRKDFSDFMLDGAENIQTKPQSRDTERPYSNRPFDRETNSPNRPTNAPQLPQIGGDSFSFDSRPGNQSQPSFIVGKPDIVSQQTGTTNDSIVRNDIPSLPSFDRGTAPVGVNGRNSIDGTIPRRQDTIPVGSDSYGRGEMPSRPGQDGVGRGVQSGTGPEFNGMGRGMPPHPVERGQLDNNNPGTGRGMPLHPVDRGQHDNNNAGAGRGMPPHPTDRAQFDNNTGSGRGILTQQPYNSGIGRGLPPTDERPPFSQPQLPGFGSQTSSGRDDLAYRNDGQNQRQFGNQRQGSISQVNPQPQFDTQRQGSLPPQPGFGNQPQATLPTQPYGDRSGSVPPTQLHGERQESAPPQPGYGERQGSIPPPQQYSERQGSALPVQQYGERQGSAAPTQQYGERQGSAPVQQYGERRQNSLSGQPSQGFMGRGAPTPGSFMDPGKNIQPNGRGRGLPSQQAILPPLKPVFGVSLDELFRRDGSAVPLLVFLCIQAVDNFGLNTEGIYRIPGSTPAVTQLKSEFDHGKSLIC